MIQMTRRPVHHDFFFLIKPTLRSPKVLEMQQSRRVTFRRVLENLQTYVVKVTTCCTVMPACTVSLFVVKHFIDEFIHMFIAALNFVLHRSREGLKETLHVRAGCESRAACSTWLTFRHRASYI